MSIEEVKGKESVATIWSWGEEFEDVGRIVRSMSVKDGMKALRKVV